MKQTNWNAFTEQVRMEITQITTHEHMTKEEIDQKVEKWCAAIESSMYNAVPMK